MILVEDSMWPVVAVGWVADGGQRDVFEWLERRRAAIRERMCAFAWVIEDDGLRACTAGGSA